MSALRFSDSDAQLSDCFEYHRYRYVYMCLDLIHTTKGRVVLTPSLLEYIDCLPSCEPCLRFRVVLYVLSLYAVTSGKLTVCSMLHSDEILMSGLEHGCGCHGHSRIFLARTIATSSVPCHIKVSIIASHYKQTIPNEQTMRANTNNINQMALRPIIDDRVVVIMWATNRCRHQSSSWDTAAGTGRALGMLCSVEASSTRLLTSASGSAGSSVAFADNVASPSACTARSRAA